MKRPLSEYTVCLADASDSKKNLDSNVRTVTSLSPNMRINEREIALFVANRPAEREGRLTYYKTNNKSVSQNTTAGKEAGEYRVNNRKDDED